MAETAKTAKSSARVFLTCAGDGERWGNYLGVPKQLLPLSSGVPLLHDTIQRLHRHGFADIVIVTHREDLSYEGVPIVRPRFRKWLVETLGSLEPFWRDDNVVLLGDVLFSEEALQQVLHSPRDLGFFGRIPQGPAPRGRRAELFAVRFRRERVPDFVRAVRDAIALARWVDATGRPARVGNYRNLLRAIRNLRCIHLRQVKKVARVVCLLTPMSPLRRQSALVNWVAALLPIPGWGWRLLRMGLLVTPRSPVLGRLWSVYGFVNDAVHQALTTRFANFVSIDDETTDFDDAADFERWRENSG